MMPWLTVFRGQTGVTDLEQAINQFQQIVKDRVAQIEDDGVDFEGRPIHLVDAFLKEIYKAENNPMSPFHKESGCKLLDS